MGGSGGSSGSYDPSGLSLRAELWGGLASLGAGTVRHSVMPTPQAMNWWWDSFVAPYNLYHVFAGPARVAATVPWTSIAWSVATGTWMNGSSANTRVLARAGNDLNSTRAFALGYVYNTDCTWLAVYEGTTCVSTPPGMLELTIWPLPQGASAVNVTFLNTTTGSPLPGSPTSAS